MERSSPLAAMQPPSISFGQWGCQTTLGPSVSHRSGEYGGTWSYAPDSFNFKDLSMARGPTDYFNLKPIRGSSPTASLAADLSQNFHIDQSPQLPTPRRSLFSQNLFGTINGRECVTTPPLPSSSPGPGNDSMDMSPLPHKAPFNMTTRIYLTSPTPEDTPTEEVKFEFHSVVPDASTDSPGQAISIERRRASLLKASMTRTKFHATNSAGSRISRAENQLPPFKFGNVSSLPTPMLMSPDECFVPSPPQEKKVSHSNPQPHYALGPPRLKQPFSSMTGHLRSTGSPTIGHVRKPSVPSQRPRKHMRRSLSMFEHPEEILKQEKAIVGNTEALGSIMDVDDVPPLKLPHFKPDEESLPRITTETMVDILDGKYGECYDQSIIVDCRFEYEYEGGHIAGAINVTNKEELATQLLQTSPADRALLVFHCEYSAHRAPLLAKFLRHRDRAANAHRYPLLSYPEVYILDGGYSSFFSDHSLRCIPQNYVEMASKEHANACERGLGKIKQQRVKLGRAQTFAFAR